MLSDKQHYLKQVQLLQNDDRVKRLRTMTKKSERLFEKNEEEKAEKYNVKIDKLTEEILACIGFKTENVDDLLFKYSTQEISNNELIKGITKELDEIEEVTGTESVTLSEFLQLREEKYEEMLAEYERDIHSNQIKV
ncbi:hypothetical protein ACQKFU_27345 [Bacillus mycoides]|uniref:hypothetical protein n=1 Tax=Bacillus mycoides TaxID=1405 RepID=UPI003D0537EC